MYSLGTIKSLTVCGAQLALNYPEGDWIFSPGLVAVSLSNCDLPWEYDDRNATTLKGLESMARLLPFQGGQLDVTCTQGSGCAATLG